MRRLEKSDAVRSLRGDSPQFGDTDRVMEQRLTLLSDDDGEAGAGPSGSCTKASSVGVGRVTLGAVPSSSLESIDSVEIPKTPSETEQWWHTDPSVVRVMGKRPDAERPGHLILC
jgi:hypothetical protein